MPLILRSTDEVAIHTSILLFGSAPSNAQFSSYKAEVARVGERDFANNAAASFANLSAGDFGAMVMDNLGLTEANIGAVNRAGLLGVVTTVFSDPLYAADRGLWALALARIVAGIPSADANYGAAATALRAGAESAFSYATDTNSLSSIDLEVLLSTVRLTSRVDVVSGNVFTAVPDYTPGGTDLVNTLQNEDVLTGTGTNPTLNATIGNSNDAAANNVTPTLNGVRTANLIFAQTDGTGLDLQDATGLEVVNLTRISAAGAEVVNMQGTATTLSAANTQARPDILLTYINEGLANEGLAGTNAATLTLNRVNANTLEIGSNDGVGMATATEQIESLTINVAAGGASTIFSLDTGVDISATSAQALTINAAANITIGRDTNDNGSVIDENAGIASSAGINSITVTGSGNVTLGNVGAMTGFTLAGGAATGNITANITNAASQSTASFTTGSGADALTATSGLAADITTNAGNDTVTISGGGLTTAASITTGAGDDTVTVTSLAGSTAGGAQISGGDGNDTVNTTGPIGEEASIVGGAGNDRVFLTPTAVATLIAGDSGGLEASDQLGGRVRMGDGDDQVWVTLRGTALGDFALLNAGRIDAGAGTGDVMWIRGTKDVAQVSAGNTDDDGDAATTTDRDITGVETLVLDSEGAYDTAGRAAAINGNSKEAHDMPNVVTANDDDGQTADYTVDLSEFDADLDTIEIIHRDGVLLNIAEEETGRTGFDGDEATYNLDELDNELINVSAFETTNVETPVGSDDFAVVDEQGTIYDSGTFDADVTVNMTVADATDGTAQRVVLKDTTASIAGALADGNDNYDVLLTGGVGLDDLALTVNTDNDHGVDLNNDFADSLTVDGTGTGNLQLVNVNSATIDTSAFAGTVYIGVESGVDHTITTGNNDDIVRMGDDFEVELGDDSIDLGDGDDIVVFNGTGSTAGINSADTVMGGAGNDVLAIGGSGGTVVLENNIVKLDASEWTEVTGFETVHLGVGTGTSVEDHNGTIENDLIRPVRYDFEVTNAFIDTNGVEASGFTGDTGTDVLNIVNDTAGSDSADMIVDLRALNRFNQVDISGGVGEDRVIFSDEPLEGRDTVDGNDGFDVLEVRNDAVVTTSDLRNVSNMEELHFVNDQAVQQTLFLTLTNAAVADTGINTIRSFGGGGVTGSAGTFAVDTVAAARVVLNAAQMTTGLTVDLSFGGDSPDVLTLGSGVDDVLAGSGEDTIVGFVGADTINGGAGTDTIRLTATSGDLNSASDGQIISVEVIDASDASAGVTINLAGQSDGFVVLGSQFGDLLTGSSGSDTILAGDGDDTVNGYTVSDVVDGGVGDDTLALGGTALNAPADFQILGVENVTGASTINLSGQSEGFNITGTAAAQAITGGNGSDTINGFVGADTIVGNGGSDSIVLTATSADLNAAGLTDNRIQTVETITAASAGAGVTITLSGQTEALQIIGSAFGDSLTGGSGSDDISAGGGDDTIVGFVGSDAVDGGAGTDTLVLSATSADLNNAVNGQLVGVEIVTAASAGAGVTINLSAQTEAIEIIGSSNADNITGGSGDDTITGGFGADTLTGSDGADTFVFGTDGIGGFDSSLAASDTVTDFATGVDKLSFGGPAGTAVNVLEIDADTIGVGPVATFAELLAAADAAFTPGGAVRYVVFYGWDVANDGVIFFDRDNNGSSEEAVVLTGVATAGDFTHTDIVGP